MASKLRVGGKKYYDLTDKVRVRFADHQGNADTFARARPRRGGAFWEVNKIETLFPKDAKGIVNWILNRLDTNVNREKALRWLVALQTHPETTIPLEELNDATNIIEKNYPAKKSGEKYDCWQERRAVGS